MSYTNSTTFIVGFCCFYIILLKTDFAFLILKLSIIYSYFLELFTCFMFLAHNQKGIDIITFIDKKEKITYDILVKQKS